jgi:hypothetical protein
VLWRRQSKLDDPRPSCPRMGHIVSRSHKKLLYSSYFCYFADAITEDINNLDVLDVRDAISDIAEMLDIIMETLIVLLLDGLEGLGGRWMLIGALEVPMNMAHSWSQE